MRGDCVTVALPGDFGKPRPALVIQADPFGEHTSVVVLLVSSMMIPAPLLRVSIQPSESNGLLQPSQIMVDKPMTVKRERLGPVFGHIESELLIQVERCLAVFLGIAK